MEESNLRNILARLEIYRCFKKDLIEDYKTLRGILEMVGGEDRRRVERVLHELEEALRTPEI
ncbi:MAG: hypothetical protein J7L11_01265 [Thermoprotei archaeon]|nr:hypothetical protein [Thermoprotei archaeon]